MKWKADNFKKSESYQNTQEKNSARRFNASAILSKGTDLNNANEAGKVEN